MPQEPEKTVGTAAGPPAEAFGSLQGVALSARDYLCFTLVFVVALALRIVYLLQVSKSPLFDSPILDAEAHDIWARMIADGVSLFSGTAYFKAPLYPYFLAFTRMLSGDLYWAPRVAQIIMGAASCGFVYLLGRDAFNRAVGLIAGLAASSYWVMIYFDTELLLEPLSIFLTLVSLWLIFRAAKSCAILTWVFAGLFMGLSAINRPNVLLIIPFIAVWILWLERRRFGFAAVRAAAWCVACALPIIPVTIRNVVEGDDFVLIASQAGPNFYIGNNPKSDGFTANLPGSRASWTGGFSDWISMAEMETGRKMKASEVDKFFFGKSWDFILNHRGRALALTLAKVQLFFYEWEIPNDSDPQSMADIYAPWMAKLPVRSGAILALGLIGFVLALFDFKRLLPLTGFLVLYSASVIAFFVCSRFRIPMMPVAIVLAAVVPVKLYMLARDRDWRTVFGIGIFTYLAWVAIHRGMLSSIINKNAAVSHQRIGQKLGEKGQPGEEEQYKLALQMDPNCEEAESCYAYFLVRKGDLSGAIRHFQKALEINGELDVHATLAAILAQQGRWDEAINTIRAGLVHLPHYLDLKRKLAFMLATCPIDRLRDGKEAVRLAEDVAAVGEEIPETYDTLAVAYAEAGRFEEATQAVEKAMRVAQEHSNIQAVLQIREHQRLIREGKPFRQNVGVTPSP